MIASTSGAMASLLSRSCFLNLASYLALVYGLAGQEPATLPAILQKAAVKTISNAVCSGSQTVYSRSGINH